MIHYCSVPRCRNIGRLVEVGDRVAWRCRSCHPVPTEVLSLDDYEGTTAECEKLGDEWAVDEVRMEDIGDDKEKPVMYFKGKKKGLVLNVTNARMIESYFGEEMDDWTGKEIEIYPDKTSFQGRIVDCLRVRVKAPLPAEDGGEEVPF
jgi:hypothetical protein